VAPGQGIPDVCPRRRSSGAEQAAHNRRVGGSSPPAATPKPGSLGWNLFDGAQSPASTGRRQGNDPSLLSALRCRGGHGGRVLPAWTLGQASRPCCVAKRLLGRIGEPRRRHSGRWDRSAPTARTTWHGSARAVRSPVGEGGPGSCRHRPHRLVRPLSPNGLGPAVAVASIAVQAPPGLSGVARPLAILTSPHGLNLGEESFGK
jgi:hypothetical protein